MAKRDTTPKPRPKLDNHGLPIKHWVVVMGRYVWGGGDTLDEAMKNAEAQNGHRSLKGEWIAYLQPDQLGITDMGYTQAHWDNCPDCRAIARGSKMPAPPKP